MAKTMVPLNVSLPKDAREHLDAKVAAGEFASADEYILRLIEDDRHSAEEESALRAEIDAGLRDLEEGRVEHYDKVEDLLADVSRQGRERLKGA